MSTVLIILFICAFAFFPLVRCIVFNIPKYIINKSVDLYDYIRYRQYNLPSFNSLQLISGCSAQSMGSGKTLFAVNTIVSIYKRYNNKVVIDKDTKKKRINKIMVMSNIDLQEIEYIPFKGFEQVRQFVDLKYKLEEENPNYRYFLYVLVDEASIFLNSSKWKDKDNPLTIESIFDLCQCRHFDIQGLMFTSQRYEMCNINVRRLSNYTLTCQLIDVPLLNKKRFIAIREYVTRDLEECTSELMIKPRRITYKYVNNKKGFHYGGYNTLEAAGKIVAKIDENDYLSEEDFNKTIENTERTGINHLTTSRKYRKKAKNQ